jgi:hypothetical protein
MIELLDIDGAGKDGCLKNSEEPCRRYFNEERTSIASITSETICLLIVVVSGFAIVNPARLELRIRAHTASHGTLGSTAGLPDNASLGISRFRSLMHCRCLVLRLPKKHIHSNKSYSQHGCWPNPGSVHRATSA